MRLLLLVLVAVLATPAAVAAPTYVAQAGWITCAPDAAAPFSPVVANAAPQGVLLLFGNAWDLVRSGGGECRFSLSLAGPAVAVPRPGHEAAGGIGTPAVNGCATLPPQGCNVSAQVPYWLDPATTLALRIPYALNLDGRELARGEVTVSP